jgi:hypothetical protein
MNLVGNRPDNELCVAVLNATTCVYATPTVVRALAGRLVAARAHVDELARENDALRAQLERERGHDA